MVEELTDSQLITLIKQMSCRQPHRVDGVQPNKGSA